MEAHGHTRSTSGKLSSKATAHAEGGSMGKNTNKHTTSEGRSAHDCLYQWIHLLEFPLLPCSSSSSLPGELEHEGKTKELVGSFSLYVCTSCEEKGPRQP